MESLEDCLLLQQSELEMLKAMYPTEEELRIDDPDVWQNHEKVIESQNPEEFKANYRIKSWSFTLNIPIKNTSVDSSVPWSVSVRFHLPIHYPVEKALISLFSSFLSREHQRALTKELLLYIEAEVPKYEQMVLPVIDWIRENAGKYLALSNNCSNSDSNEKKCHSEDQSGVTFCVMWLYMHHIYNKEKRKNILQWAQELHLCGFSLPGKPGVVYVEGSPEDINDYFVRLRRLNWQKMSCKQRDIFKVNSIDDVKKFNDFQEIAFDVHGSRGYHMDMGQFRKYLLDHDLEYIFNELFSTKS